MCYIKWLLGLVLFFLILGFAAKNSEPATLVFYLGYSWNAPLILILLVVFLGGMRLGVVGGSPVLLRQGRIIRQLISQLPIHDSQLLKTAESNQHGV